MRRRFAPFLVLALALGSCAGDGGPVVRDVAGEPVRVARLQRTYAEVMARARIPAISCAILNGGEVAHLETFGVRSAESGEPADAETVFAAASFSKTVFAYLVMILEEEGEMYIDVPVETYLRDRLANDPRYADLAGDLRTTLITGRQALSHTIGFPNWRFLTEDGKLRLNFEPGERFSYSGEGISLLQRVMEKRMGRGLEELARQKIFQPLGMTRTSYVWQTAFEDNHALPHDEFGRPRRLSRRRDADAAGSMYTTASDYARFLGALLSALSLDGPRRDTVEAMLARQVSIDSAAMFGPRAAETTRAHEDLRLGWSLGFGRFETRHGPAIFHTGHDFGWQNYTVTHLTPGTGIVLLSNSNNFESVARELVGAALGDEESPFDWLGYPRFDPKALRQPPPDPVVVDVPEEVLADYVGDYSFMADRVVTFKLEHGVLWVTSGDGEWDELAATSPTELFIPGGEAAFRFVPSPGRPPRLVVLADALEIHARPLADALEIPEVEDVP